jgi:hypothetical protein
VIGVCSLAVIILQFADPDRSAAAALLYVLPIALAAVTFGLPGGLATAAAGYVAFAAFQLASGADPVSAEGWVARAAAMFLLGGLLGRASDQTAQATRLALTHQRERQIAEEQNRRYGQGLELSDSILQHVATAKWAIERGEHSKAAELLTRALSSGQEMVGDLLPPVAGPGTPQPGTRQPGPPQPGTQRADAPPGRRRSRFRRSGAEPSPPHSRPCAPARRS